jgi:hypothetical protein
MSADRVTTGPLHREMRALTQPTSSSTVAPRSRRQRLRENTPTT